MNNINAELKSIFDTNKYNINAIGVSKKVVDNQKTNEECITFSVTKKKSPEDLGNEEVIPATITIDGKTYKTDVVEHAPVEALTCYNPTASPMETEIVKLRTMQATNNVLAGEIMGGQQIVLFPDNFDGRRYGQDVSAFGIASGDFAAVVGTLGFMAIDNEDDKVVGITNAHVACAVLLENDDRTLADEQTDPYSLTEERSFVGFNQTFTAPAQARVAIRETTTDDYFIVTTSHGNDVPSIKRASFYDTDSNNTVDVAVLAVSNTLFNNDSYQINQPSGTTQITSHFEFATTQELDNLMTNPPSGVYSVGRTTGPKGWGATTACQLEVSAINVTSNVGFTERGQAISVGFTDLIRFQYADNSNFPVAGGDSGSALIADMDGLGTYKIIGLVFAGNGGALENPSGGTHIGLACRIDNVATEMNIRAWTSSETPDFTQSTLEVITRPYLDSIPEEATITVDGNTYYNAGLRFSSRITTSSGDNVQTQSGDTIQQN